MTADSGLPDSLSPPLVDSTVSSSHLGHPSGHEICSIRSMVGRSVDPWPGNPKWHVLGPLISPYFHAKNSNKMCCSVKGCLRRGRPRGADTHPQP